MVEGRRGRGWQGWRFKMWNNSKRVPGRTLALGNLSFSHLNRFVKGEVSGNSKLGLVSFCLASKLTGNTEISGYLILLTGQVLIGYGGLNIPQIV
jgi:hypothetical protein